MKLPKDSRTSPHSRNRSRRLPSIGHSAAGAVLLGTLLFSSSTHFASAKTHQTSDARTAPDIDPDAMEALNKMGAYLRTLKSFQVAAENTTDDVLEDGQVVQNSTKVNLLAARPNRLRVEVTGDDKHRFYFYDGKNFTVWGQMVNFYATVPAPATIGELIDKVDEKYNIELPLTDLFKWGTDKDAIKRIQKAVDIGPASIDGVTCEQYAFRQEGTDWQIWIQLGEFPLPRKLVIQTLTDDAKPQHSESLSWNLAPSFSDDAFTFAPDPDARRIVLAETDSDNNQKVK